MGLSPTPVICPSPEYFYSPYTEPEYIGVPLEPPGPPLEYEDATQAGPSTAAIIASQSQDYVDEKLAEYQATIHQLQGRAHIPAHSREHLWEVCHHVLVSGHLFFCPSEPSY
ncbi:hypothetical protein Cfor_07189 [Coptotermes formosanus]|uniref:Uncharacterized protein n=1 Tax=Coptotermes formosanus TaxID=36987 RepID=A0A6L2Q6J3_COPFO|nr:hypothetical protein Cfor_07189 [Coptotermes formosanus]